MLGRSSARGRLRVTALLPLARMDAVRGALALAHGRRRCRFVRHGTSLGSGSCRPSGRSGQPAHRRAAVVRVPAGGMAVPLRLRSRRRANTTLHRVPFAVSAHDRATIGRGRSAQRARHATETIEASFDRAEAYSVAISSTRSRAAAVTVRRRTCAARAGSGGRRPARRADDRQGDVASIAGERRAVFELPARPAAVSAARRALLAANGGLPSTVRDDVLHRTSPAR